MSALSIHKRRLGLHPVKTKLCTTGMQSVAVVSAQADAARRSAVASRHILSLSYRTANGHRGTVCLHPVNVTVNSVSVPQTYEYL